MTQRTIKHGDWVKIVESRTEQKKQSLRKSSRKNAPKNNKMNVPFISMLLGGFIILASAWMYFSGGAKAQGAMLDVTAQNKISRYFSKQFMMGSWQFKRAKFDDGEVNIFISIPQKLSMNEKELEGYIKHSLCPPASSRVWLDINKSELYINLYVDSPRKGNFAQCQNPNSHA
ncbi:hypothetical protein CWB96_14130 [Pseudoalteromonas citrea]|uniref:Uncharacterized protein n=1 Tax=Pseudoalteromonas citrea TaxID=43655 RepID=A0A5S3XNS6_9GAMM|nr:hypothetical protein [Pseudoalteromonas citrea]TMP41372.1 hypothetical protein CWB97_14670 [Pseudoalteromonas citrea]TMP57060.1 hypothetical protein CWB96_14130 [Pseudoalteromonas citrea]